MNNTFIGCDPDTHSCAFAAVDSIGMPVWVHVSRVDKKYKHMQAALAMAKRMAEDSWGGNSPAVAAAVEGQEIAYSVKSGTNPRSMLPVSVVAGAAIQLINFRCLPGSLHEFSFPLPAEWKGQVPKQIHQARLCSALGWVYEAVGTKEDGYCRPVSPPDNLRAWNKGDWKHIMDAIGLARYAREKYLYQQRVASNR